MPQNPRLADTALVIPSLGSATLSRCLEAVATLDPGPGRVVVVVSGPTRVPADTAGHEIVRSPSRLGFAAAVNTGLEALGGSASRIALLNDDAMPSPAWLAVLGEALDSDSRIGSVQGTVTDLDGRLVDGRGITVDRCGLPIQVDRGRAVTGEDHGFRPLIAVSCTAALFRASALDEARLRRGAVLDPGFGSYHEDFDLGLRLGRIGWTSGWVGGACTTHSGSATGRGLRWRNPWWLLANRWRALAGNLSRAALLRSLPSLVRGELRAIRTLVRSNPRVLPVALVVAAALPVLIAAGWRRITPGERLEALPGTS
jgi:GT2 family glycosyltransferase